MIQNNQIVYSICYREDLIHTYRSLDPEERLALYEKYVYMREIFNLIDLEELTEKNKKEE